MTKTKATNASKKLNSNGIEADVRDNYSGRGMYGAETYAVVINNVHDMQTAMLLCRGLFSSRRDAMGMGIVFY
jgi:hypothetical protein